VATTTAEVPTSLRSVEEVLRRIGVLPVESRMTVANLRAGGAAIAHRRPDVRVM
jgi:hypothetical protein